MLTSWSRRTEDLTTDKTDEKDAVLIARLTAQLRCYVPGPVDETWGRLRHLGTRREQLITEAGGQVQQMRDLLECAWPAGLDTARQPFRPGTRMAALPVIAGRDRGTSPGPGGWERPGSGHVVRREITRRGGQKPCLRIVRGLFTALADPAGVIAHRPGTLERVALLLEDWQLTKSRLAQAEQRMTAVLDELGLTALVTSITGLSPVGAAAILAETGDPRRYDSSSSLVKHAGLSPSENASGAFEGQAHISRRGRPGLRLTAWRAVWPMLQFNPVMAAKYAAMTQAADAAAADARSQQARPAAVAARARRAKARVACAASLLRWIYSMVVHGTSWDAAVASGAACQPEAA